MIVSGGFSTYGQTIGIIMFKGVTPRIPGDIGHAETLGFHVCYEILDDVSFMDLVDGNTAAKESLLSAAKRLEQKGVRAITGDCGLLCRYQEEIASQLSIPFFSSSLLLIPLVWQLQGRRGKISVITGHSQFLKQHHLINAGVGDNIPLAIGGMENQEEFKKVVMNGSTQLDTENMKNGVLKVCEELLNNNTDICSFVLECSNLPSFAYDIYNKFKLPVYDIVGLAKLMYSSVVPNNYTILK